MSKKKVLLRGVFINRDTNGEGVLKVGTTLIRVSTVMGILYKFCNDNKYELIWFCKDIERVYLRKKVVKDENKKEAGKFKANKTIRNIDAKNLVASNYKDGTSNILNILDKYLERK